jgi:prepilin-type N-terminal cleavage/methylation domain-containing protein
MLAPMRRSQSVHSAFTLVEILVVLGIISCLSALLFPTLAKAKARARQTSCISQLHQLGLAMMMYATDSGGLAPRLSALYPTYLPDPAVLVCPSDPVQGQHEPNDYLEGGRYLASGVSYTYLPNWKYSWQLGWWRRPPSYGPGLYGDLTPLAACNWHWATRWDPGLDEPVWGAEAKGWVLVLAVGGSVKAVRAEIPPSEFAPNGG